MYSNTERSKKFILLFNIFLLLLLSNKKLFSKPQFTKEKKELLEQDC